MNHAPHISTYKLWQTLWVAAPLQHPPPCSMMREALSGHMPARPWPAFPNSLVVRCGFYDSILAHGKWIRHVASGSFPSKERPVSSSPPLLPFLGQWQLFSDGRATRGKGPGYLSPLRPHTSLAIPASAITKETAFISHTTIFWGFVLCWPRLHPN